MNTELVRTGFGVGRVVWTDKKGETAKVRLLNGTLVNVLVSELKIVKRSKFLPEQ